MKFKVWAAIISALSELAVVLCTTLMIEDGAKLATIITAGTASVLTILAIVLGAHAYTDAKVTSAMAIADAMRVNPLDPTKPGHA